MKRRIDFEKEHANNNATVSNKSLQEEVSLCKGKTEKMNKMNKIETEQVQTRATRSKATKESVKGMSVPLSSYRVQWTKEFMEKVRKSNEKEKLKDKQLKSKNPKQKLDEPNVELIQFQNPEQKGDGVQTNVDLGTDGTEELLDYEDG